ncbi:hypothetical protein [[Mycobacterium] crassicus]|uniref:DUF222 domain-containing protein n=1 Tax=[Mycobacterium] crassicus TaxID=2872309 RepID=A0ABU5XGL4_9MYCO|nr:hypothetical protein [Mycolicibacter sp. MYC098]MEB3021298.1 hypothetical protein [Mycolicibacter sp. MYC098]
MPKTKPADRPLVDLLEQAFTTGLIHPGSGDGPIALPHAMFGNSTMPDEMTRHFAEDAGLPHANIARLVAEAIVDVMEKAGKSGAATIRKAETAARRARRGPNPAPAPVPAAPAPASAPGPRPSIPEGSLAGNMIVTLNGATLMRDLGDWTQRPPEQIAQHLKNPAKAPAWAKALIAAIVDTATTGRAQHVDITTDDQGGWTMQVSAA